MGVGGSSVGPSSGCCEAFAHLSSTFRLRQQWPLLGWGRFPQDGEEGSWLKHRADMPTRHHPLVPFLYLHLCRGKKTLQEGLNPTAPLLAVGLNYIYPLGRVQEPPIICLLGVRKKPSSCQIVSMAPAAEKTSFHFY